MKKGTTLNVGDLILSEMREYKPFSFVPHLKKNPEKILHHVCTNNTSPCPPCHSWRDVQRCPGIKKLCIETRTRSKNKYFDTCFKVLLLDLRQFMSVEIPLRVMKNACSLWNVLSVVKMFKFLSQLFGHVGKRFDKKAKLDFEI